MIFRIEDTQIRRPVLDEGDAQLAGIAGVHDQEEHGHHGHHQLARQFGPAADAAVLGMAQLGHVVPKPHGREAPEHQQGLPDIEVAQITVTFILL